MIKFRCPHAAFEKAGFELCAAPFFHQDLDGQPSAFRDGDILIEFRQQASEVIQMGGIDFHDANSMIARFDVSFRPHVAPVLRGRHIGFHALHSGAKLRWNVHLFSAIHTVVQPKLLPSPHPHAAEFGLPLGRRARALALFFCFRVSRLYMAISPM